MNSPMALHHDPTFNGACALEARERRAANADQVITRRSMVAKVTALLNARGSHQAKVMAERKNIAEWWEDCECSSTDHLLEKRAYLREVIRFARDMDDVFYYETRGLHLDIVNEFLPPSLVGEGRS